MTSGKNRKIYPSDICISGKRIRAMREIARAMFGKSFLFIEVCDGRFLVTVDDKIDLDDYDEFTSKYFMCRIRIHREIDASSLRDSSKR